MIGQLKDEVPADGPGTFESTDSVKIHELNAYYTQLENQCQDLLFWADLFDSKSEYYRLLSEAFRIKAAINEAESWTTGN